MSEPGQPSGGNELWPEDLGWTRGGILPLEWQGDSAGRRLPGGQIRLAAPEMLRGMVNDLYYTLTTPGRVASGQEQNPDANRMAMTLMGQGEAGAPLRNGLGVFGGTMAKTADTDMLRRAMNLEASGVEPEHIWHSTGWMKGPDGQWKFEIPDTAAAWKGPTSEASPRMAAALKADPDLGHLAEPWTRLTGPEVTPAQNLTLKDVLHHPELYKAYPDLADVPVTRQTEKAIQEGTRGSSGPGGIKLTNMPLQEAVSVSLHEIQHQIQDKEGFARGGSPNEFLPGNFNKIVKLHNGAADDLDNVLLGLGFSPRKIYGGVSLIRQGKAEGTHVTADTLDYGVGQDASQQLHDLKTQHPEIYEAVHTQMDNGERIGTAKLTAHANYQRLGGEVESRTVQERHATGDYTNPPWKTQGYPEGPQIILGKNQKHNIIPVLHNPFEHRLEAVDHDPFAEEEGQ